MGRLSVVKGVYGKRDVSSVIRKLLARQVRTGATAMDPEALAATLADLVWERNPGLLNDPSEPPPHLLVLAALALAQGFRSLPESGGSRFALTVALGNILAELEVNACDLLSGLDRQLIVTITETFAEMLAEYNAQAVAN